LRNTGITALVLAGGRGLRMGGADKGLQPFRGQPLVQHALQRLAAQQGGALHATLINANRNAQQYRALGEAVVGAGCVEVVPDGDAEFAGPLAGFQAGLAVCRSPLMLTVPCDSPLFPLDLAARLHAALVQAQADIAVAQALQAGHDGVPTLRTQPVFCLMRTALGPGLQTFLAQGGRKVGDWMAPLRRVDVAFNNPGDDTRAFANVNTLEELRRLEGP
jgi:molybdenum cofactor guanylyltransferase